MSDVNIEQVREAKHSPVVRVDLVAEAIAKKLFGIENLKPLDKTPQERLRVSRAKQRYIKNAVKAGRDAVADELERLREFKEYADKYHNGIYEQFDEWRQR